MKSGRQHRVPLSPQALAILDQLRQIRSCDFVFPSPRRAKPLSNMAMEMLLRRMKADAITVHGFRSSFRTGAARKPIIRASSPKPRWPMRSATLSRGPIVVAMRWRSANS